MSDFPPYYYEVSLLETLEEMEELTSDDFAMMPAYMREGEQLRLEALRKMRDEILTKLPADLRGEWERRLGT